MMARTRNRSARSRREKGSGKRDEDLRRFLPLLPRILLILLALSTATLVVLPTGYLLVWSLLGTDVVGQLTGISEISVAWYASVLGDSAWRDSLVCSTGVAACSGAFGTAIVLMSSYFLRLHPTAAETVTLVAISVVLLTPQICYAMALRWSGALFEMPEMLVLTLGHVALVLPLQYYVLDSASDRVASEMLAAGRSLGASHLRNFYFVYLPNMARPTLAAFLVGFFVSFDEVVVAVFVLEGSLVTVPLRLWQQLSHRATPDPAVVAALMILMFGSFVLLYWASGDLARRLRRRSRK